MKRLSDIPLLIALLLLIAVLFVMNLSFGDVAIKIGDVIHLLGGGEVENTASSYIVESRLYRSVAAIGAGGALAVSGLILQVFFRNPLAGPSVLGVTSGASLGVAAVILGGVSMGSVWGSMGIIGAGIIGAIGVLLLLLFISRFIKNAVTLLVAGLMFGYFTSALINILFLWANEMNTREYVIWGLGSFDGFRSSELLIFWMIILVVFFFSFVLVKPLNALVTGTDYASSLGVNIKSARFIIIIVTGILAAVVTVYCGPVSFVGIAVPQLARIVVRSKNHAVIMPLVFFAGGCLALLADFVVRMSSNSLPLNTVTALIGAPIVVWVIVKMNRTHADI